MFEHCINKFVLKIIPINDSCEVITIKRSNRMRTIGSPAGVHGRVFEKCLDLMSVIFLLLIIYIKKTKTNFCMAFICFDLEPQGIRTKIIDTIL